MNELWKDIPGFEGYYQASNLGNIKRISGQVWHTSKAGKRHLITKKERILNFTNKINGAGYHNVTLSIDNIIYYRDVHRLIALTFLGEPNSFDVNHMDGNKLNNKIDNLEYLTRLENIHHALQMGLKKSIYRPLGELNPRAKLTKSQSDEIKILLTQDKVSIKQIASLYKISTHSIYNIKYKKCWV